MSVPRVQQRYGAASVTGPRERNEDSYLLSDISFEPGPVLARIAVADGMGGHQAGAVASRLAVETAGEALLRGENDSGALRDAFTSANRRIRAFGTSLGEGQSMGTTLTFAVVLPNEAVIGHIGDSRAWLLHGTQLEQITVDHSRVGRLLRAGVLSEREVIGHPEANVLERALGAGDSSEPDIYRVGLGPGDVLLLSTDGLHGALGRQEIVGVLHGTPSMQLACERLAVLAGERGSTDNVTVVAWQYPERATRTRTIPAGSEAVLEWRLPIRTPLWSVLQVAERAARDPRGRLLAAAAVAGFAVGFALRLVSR